MSPSTTSPITRDQTANSDKGENAKGDCVAGGVKY